MMPRRMKKWKSQTHRGEEYRRHRVAIAEDRGKAPQCRFDQNPVGDVGDAADEPISESREKAGIGAESGLGVGVDAGVKFGLAFRQNLEHPSERVHAEPGDRPRDKRTEWSGRDAEGARQREYASDNH